MDKRRRQLRAERTDDARPVHPLAAAGDDGGDEVSALAILRMFEHVGA